MIRLKESQRNTRFHGKLITVDSFKLKKLLRRRYNIFLQENRHESSKKFVILFSNVVNYYKVNLTPTLSFFNSYTKYLLQISVTRFGMFGYCCPHMDGHRYKRPGRCLSKYKEENCIR